MTETARGPWLAAFSGEPAGRCPKCLTSPVVTEHHDSVVFGMCAERRASILALSETPGDVPDETTEHLCRGCPECGYTWSEHVATADDMARVKAVLINVD
jgi:ribosomal protein S27AE